MKSSKHALLRAVTSASALMFLGALAVQACGTDDGAVSADSGEPQGSPDAAPPVDARVPVEGGGGPRDGGLPPDVVPPPDGGLDAAPAPDATPDGPGADAGVDATPDVGPTDAVADTARVDAGALEATVAVSRLFQNCMPIVPTDPLSMSGSLDLVNRTPGTVGPVVAQQGEVRDLAGNLLTTFQLDATISAGPLLAGQSASAPFSKRRGSASPIAGCRTLVCNSDVRVSLPITGAGVPAGASARSPVVKVTCAF